MSGGMDSAYEALLKRVMDNFETPTWKATPKRMACKLYWTAMSLWTSSTPEERQQWAAFSDAQRPEEVKVEVLRQQGAEDERFALLRAVRPLFSSLSLKHTAP